MEVIPEIGYCNPFEKEINEVKVATATPDTDGKIRLCADMLRFENSYVYIELEYEDGKNPVIWYAVPTRKYRLVRMQR